jgi:hypothetical protein
VASDLERSHHLDESLGHHSPDSYPGGTVSTLSVESAAKYLMTDPSCSFSESSGAFPASGMAPGGKS